MKTIFISIIITVFLSLSSFKLFSQNLVLNSSFEEYWKKPTIYDIYNRSDTFWAKDWYNIYIAPCLIEYNLKNSYTNIESGKEFKLFNVPENNMGFHPAQDGDAYIGIIPFGFSYNGSGITEHITGTFKKPLENDKLYEISFFIRHGGNKCALFFNKLEVVFEKDSSIIVLPHNYKCMSKNTIEEKTDYDSIFLINKRRADVILNFSQNNDSIYWIKLTGNYFAKGGEKYFSIGLFYQGDTISANLKKMNSAYSRVWLNKKKRLKFLKNIKKHSVSFIKFYKNYEINNFISDKGISPTSDGGYYFIDNVSVTLLNKKNK